MVKSIFFTLAALYLVNARPVKRGILPVTRPTFLPQFPFNGVKPHSPVPTGPLSQGHHLNKAHYPQPWTKPDINHPGVQAAIKAIDWSYVPKFSPRTMDMVYDVSVDEACWWSKSQCTSPRVSYLPEDVKYCPNIGDFGLTYDDGPLPPRGDNDPWAEPRLYDFLAKHDQLATLFYVGSNVIAIPEAAVRALQAGHTLCAHTWSHLQMTTLSNDDIVAQLYWSMRVIKDAAGVTTRCWRPPYGDVDDRVRAIAHQMGLATIIWDSDSFDWGLPSVANNFQGTSSQENIDSYFQRWINERPQDEIGHIVLEHETSNMTISTSETWLPKLKEVFNVKTVHACAPQLPNPYWES